MSNFETVADTRWGVKKVKHGLEPTATVRYSKPLRYGAELPIKAAGSIVPFWLGNLAGQILEYVPVVDQFTSNDTNMLLGILAAGYGFLKSGLVLNDNMEIAGITVTPFHVPVDK